MMVDLFNILNNVISITNIKKRTKSYRRVIVMRSILQTKYCKKVIEKQKHFFFSKLSPSLSFVALGFVQLVINQFARALKTAELP